MDRKTRTKGEKMHALRVVGEQGRQGRADSGGDGHFKRGLACRTKRDGTVTHQRGCSRPEPMAEKWRIPGGSPPRYALARLLGQPSLIASRAAARPLSGARSGQRNENRHANGRQQFSRATIGWRFRASSPPRVRGARPPPTRRADSYRTEGRSVATPLSLCRKAYSIVALSIVSTPRLATSRRVFVLSRPVPKHLVPFFPARSALFTPSRLIAPSRTVQTPPW